jgi:hypothetical protein
VSGVVEKVNTGATYENAQALDILAESVYPLVLPISGRHAAQRLFNTSNSAPSPGFVFPYFKGMLDPSKEYCYSVITRYFLKCLADDPDHLSRVLPALRKGLRSLALSEEGRVLQHIAFGITSSIESGAELRVLFDGRTYRGFILLSDDIYVINRNKVLQPLDAEQLTEEIEDLDVHGKSLRGIVAIGNTLLSKSSGMVEIITVEAASKFTSRTFSRWISSKNLSGLGDEQKDQLVEMMDSLAFGENFLEINETHMIDLINHLESGTDWPAMVPAYTKSGAPLNDDLFMRLLSAFGPSAPTLIGGNKEIRMQAPGEKDKNLVKDVSTGRYVLQYIPFYEKPLMAAIQDWKSVQVNAMFKIREPKNKASKKFADFYTCIITGENVEDSYNSLRRWSFRHKQVLKTSRAMGKRPAEGDKAEGPSGKKFKGLGDFM